eukprot:GHVR01070169.1.p1 GENE.GHVR01070169.1~~GHVR01070169.1.p1  ORF type:complete len:509 (+),score=90.75 GHVR01070169.1:60-1586(+)
MKKLLRLSLLGGVLCSRIHDDMFDDVQEGYWETNRIRNSYSYSKLNRCLGQEDERQFFVIGRDLGYNHIRWIIRYKTNEDGIYVDQTYIEDNRHSTNDTDWVLPDGTVCQVLRKDDPSLVNHPSKHGFIFNRNNETEDDSYNDDDSGNDFFNDTKESKLNENIELNDKDGISLYVLKCGQFELWSYNQKYFDMSHNKYDGNHACAYTYGDSLTTDKIHYSVMPMLTQYFDPKYYNNEVWNPRHVAAYNGHLGALKLMISLDANDTNTTGEDYNSHSNIARDSVGNTLLHMAVYGSDKDTATYLIDVLGIDVNLQNNNGLTPLLVAVMINDVPMIKFLIEKGANVNAADEKGYTSLHYVYSTHNVMRRKYVYDNGKYINQLNFNDYYHLITQATDLLLKAGAKNMANNFGEYPVHTGLNMLPNIPLKLNNDELEKLFKTLFTKDNVNQKGYGGRSLLQIVLSIGTLFGLGAAQSPFVLAAAKALIDMGAEIGTTDDPCIMYLTSLHVIG